jgi:hypothetical protein
MRCSQLDDRSQAKALSLPSQLLGNAMPFWYALSAFLAICRSHLDKIAKLLDSLHDAALEETVRLEIGIVLLHEHVGSQENGITLACRCILCGRRLRNYVQYPRLGVLYALLQPCSHSRGTIPDYTATTSHSVVLDYVQFFGRTFWRVRKLTLSLTKRRAHIPSIKTAVMDLLTESARSAWRDADRSTHPPH